MTTRSLEEKWDTLTRSYGGMIDNPIFPNWIPFKKAFLEGKLTWDVLRTTRMCGLVYDTWLIYKHDIDPVKQELPPRVVRNRCND